VNKLVKQFKASTAEMARIAQKVEEELEAYEPKPLRVRINEGFKRFITSKTDGFTAGKELLADFGCKSTVDLKTEQLEKFVDAIGGI